MKTVLLVGSVTPACREEVRSALEGSYALVDALDPKEAVKLLEERRDIAAVLIDEPCRQPGLVELLEMVRSGVSSFRSIPVLLLCSADTLDQDLAFLGGPVEDVVLKPVRAQLILNRLERATARTNSMTFQDLTDILKLLPSNIYIKDDKGRYIFTSENSGDGTLRGDNGEDIIGKTDVEIRMDKENAQKALEADMEIIHRGVGTSYVIHVGEGDDVQHLQIIKEPIMKPDGSAKGIITLINNVTEQVQLRERLEKVSITDQLTGLYNRSYLDPYAKNVHQDESAYPISLISLDCDGLKLVNDTLGHLAGDEYLRDTADLLTRILPKRGACFRIGGDEFLCVLPKTGLREVARLAMALIDHAGEYAVVGIQLSVSVGYSTMLRPEDSFAACFKRSDEEMYKDKATKHDRYRR